VPTYEYTCRDCGHTFEIVQSMWDDALTMCPECGGSLRKVFAPPAISFKGTGFYATDHGRKAKRSDGEKKEAKEPVTSGTDTGASGSKEGAASGDGAKTSTTAKKEPATS
jgi:putative FmdB family regulatory protein